MISQLSSFKEINMKSGFPRRKKWRRKRVNSEKSLNHPAGISRQACTCTLIALAASLAFNQLYGTTPLSHDKGRNVNYYSKLSKTTSQNIIQRILQAYCLTYLAHIEKPTDNSILTSVHLHFQSLLYLYHLSDKDIASSSLSSKNYQKQTHMASQSRVHPTSSLPFSETNNPANQINFFPPYEEVNLANLFTNVQITDDDRIYIPSDPYKNYFIPFGSLSYLEENNMFHSSLHENDSDIFEESLFLKNPPNSPEKDFHLVCSNSLF